MKEQKFEIGETVILNSNFSKNIVTVEKITPSGLIRIKGGHSLFNKDGYMRGQSGYNLTYITKSTPEEIKEIQRFHMAEQLRRYGKWEILSFDELVSIIKIIKEKK